MAMPKHNALALFKAEDLDLVFPAHKDFVPDKVALATQKVIISKGSYTPDGKAYVEKSAIPQLLGTHMAGANQFYNNLSDKDKLKNGDARLVHIASIMGEMSRRIQEPFPPNKVENLKHAEDCLRAYRDHPELERRRTISEAQMRQDWPKVREEARTGVTLCELTGQLLVPKPHVHHAVRWADNPSLALDKRNLAVANPDPHAAVHKAGALSPEQLEAFAKENGGAWRVDVES